MKWASREKYWFLRITGRVYKKNSKVKIKNAKLRCPIIIFILLVCFPSYGFGITVSEIANHLREKYDKAKTIIIYYRQFIQIKGLERVDEFKGKAVFSSPEKFRWEGINSENRKEIIIITGKDMMIYNTETNHLMKKKTIVSLEKELKERYLPWLQVTNDMRTKYIETSEGEDKIYKLEVLPLSSDDYRNMYFWVDGKDFNVIKIEIIDPAENKITLFFDSTVFSKDVQEDEFIFQPKPGTQILEVE